MSSRPFRDVTCTDGVAESVQAYVEAARLLQALPPDSPQVRLTRILELARQAVRADKATFWQVSRNGNHLLQIATSADDPIAPNATLADLLGGGRVRIWRKCSDTHFETLRGSLHLSSRCECALTLPAGDANRQTSLLCIEFQDADRLFSAELEIFVRLVMARLELACPAKAPGNSNDGFTSSSDSGTTLQTSHLSLTEENLRDIFYFAPTAMLLTTPEATHPVAANRHALALFNVLPRNSENLRSCDFWDEPAEREAFVRQVLANGFVRGHRVRLRKADGARFWARISTSAIDYDGSPALMSSVTDISEAVAAEEILNRTQQTLATLLETSPFPLVVTRLDTGVVRYCNQRAADMFETPLAGLIGRTAPEFYVDPSDREAFVERLRRVGCVDEFVARLKTGSGKPFWAMLSAKTLELNDEPIFMVAFADMTRQKNKEEELEDLAFKDVLTNTYNRRYFMEVTQIELARASRNSRFPVLALLDIDYFKRVNDTWGHEAGDDVLREFAQRVSGLLRKTDILARYGGEEFSVLFPETDVASARDIVERIRIDIAKHRFASAAGQITVTFSAGLTAAGSTTSHTALVRQADLALYAAKHAGRNRIEITSLAENRCDLHDSRD
ncbi:MAG: diguanylate cyclase [Proteobacteria bacterium]|nr:diguanylate cyclase [Pseudomonadota bacterium]